MGASGEYCGDHFFEGVRCWSWNAPAILSFPLPDWVEDHDGLMSIRFSNVFPTVTLLLQAGN